MTKPSKDEVARKVAPHIRRGLEQHRAAKKAEPEQEEKSA